MKKNLETEVHKGDRLTTVLFYVSFILILFCLYMYRSFHINFMNEINVFRIIIILFILIHL